MSNPFAVLSGGAGGIDISNPATALSETGAINTATGAFSQDKGVSNSTVIVIAAIVGVVWALR